MGVFMIKTRIRDFVISKDDWILSVVEYDNRNGINCMLRYVPDPKGERVKDNNGKRYKKFDFDEAISFIKSKKPEYLVGDILLISEKDVKTLLKPEERLKDATNKSEELRLLVNLLIKEGVREDCMGITGSRLVGLQNDDSDIDFVVYGNEWYKARDRIIKLKKQREINEIDEDTWRFIYNKRRPEISFNEFIIHEKRKENRGLINNRYFDLLYVRSWDEIKDIYLPIQKRKICRKKIESTVIGDKYAFDSPAIYELDKKDEGVDMVVSFTHTYVGQCFKGERIEASGVLEYWDDKKILVVGTTREARGEYIRSLSLLEDIR
ncbi:DNA polymerase subunit beta [Candidatus Methanoliparum sp. LAM-1]|nr:DNA polymerase subunit beta [Candidatus Methanoliparum sp. LAM-1]